MEKLDGEMDEALAEEGDIEGEAVTENVERCQEVLMLLEESLFNIGDFEEEVEERKGEAFAEELQGAAVNVASTTSDQEQRDVATVERVNVSAENFISYRMSGTEAASREDSVSAAVAEDQAGGRRIVFIVFGEDEDQPDTVEEDVVASVFAQFDSLGSSGNTFQGLHSQPSGTSNLNPLGLQQVAQSRLWDSNVLVNEDFNREAGFGGNSVWSSSKPSTSGQRSRGASRNLAKNQRKKHQLEDNEADVESGRRDGEVGGRRDGDVRVVGGWRVGDVGDAGVDGDGVSTVREARRLTSTETTHDKRSKTKRGNTNADKLPSCFHTTKKTVLQPMQNLRERLQSEKQTLEGEKMKTKQTKKNQKKKKKKKKKTTTTTTATTTTTTTTKMTKKEYKKRTTKQLKKSIKRFSKRANVKLPKVELPKFDGTVTEWMSFRDCFGNAVHQNSSLSKIDKFTYLKASLTGKAAETIAGLPLTSANYDSAWGLLEKQFGDKQRLIANFMNKLVKISSVAESRDVRLRGFLGQVEVIIRGLQSVS